MNTIKQQFEAMLRCGIMSCMEYQTSKENWLLVNIECNDQGIEFSFDSEGLPVSFDGEVITINDNRYVMPFDEYFEDLDYYLQAIDQNITEGFLLPNNLYYVEDNEV